MAAVGLGDGSVEGLVVHVVDVSAVVTTGVRRRKSAADQLGEKVARLLPMDDTGDRRVLAEQADAGVEHHQHQKARLALGESDLHDGGDTSGLSHNNSSARWGSDGR